MTAVLWLLGPSGVGKSTVGRRVYRMLAGEPPGQVRRLHRGHDRPRAVGKSAVGWAVLSRLVTTAKSAYVDLAQSTFVTPPPPGADLVVDTDGRGVEVVADEVFDRFFSP
ncbi:hypothetical protein [Saccharothrix sp. HUAS TT1]|uniref:hypothetical protein n=1 Tax=unclassified Saccharothrix TaxID=2593673 RepID=UPI00345BF36C